MRTRAVLLVGLGVALAIGCSVWRFAEPAGRGTSDGANASPAPVPYPDPGLDVPNPVEVDAGDPRLADLQRWIDAAKGPDPRLQYSAANHLRRLGDPRATDALVHILKSSTMGVALPRVAALLPLRAWRRLDAVPVLIDALDPDGHDRDALPPDVAARALDDITHRSAGLSDDDRLRVRAGGMDSKASWLAWWSANEARLRRELGQSK